MKKLKLGDIIKYNNLETYIIISIYIKNGNVYLILKDTEIESFKIISLEEYKLNYKIIGKSDNTNYVEVIKFEGN